MSLPKYSSPQVISDSIRIVSRRALQLEDGVGDGAALGGEADRMTPERKDVEGLYAKLDKIVSKRLKLKRVLELPDETSLSKKHKARREEGEGKSAGCQQDSMPVVFRLVSKRLPPRVIHLSPKPSVVLPVRERPCEDTDQELIERVYRSTLSAVDLEQIKHSFGMLQKNDRRLQRVLQTTSPSHATTAPLLLLEIPRATPTPLWTNSRLDVPPKLSPHQLKEKGVCCPIASATPPRARGARKKRRREPKNKNKLFP